MVDVIIINSVVHRLKKTFFVLLQTEDGDVFKLTFDYMHAVDKSIGAVTSIRIKYFETLPLAFGLCLLKSGFLFLAAEFGNHTLFQIENLGDDEEDMPEFTSEEYDGRPLTFTPRNLRNLSPVDEIESLSPLIDSKVLNLTGDDTPQIYSICGKGSRSTFRILKHGLEVNEVAISELPGNPNAVWTVRGPSGMINFI